MNYDVSFTVLKIIIQHSLLRVVIHTSGQLLRSYVQYFLSYLGLLCTAARAIFYFKNVLIDFGWCLLPGMLPIFRINPPKSCLLQSTTTVRENPENTNEAERHHRRQKACNIKQSKRRTRSKVIAIQRT